MPFPNGENGIAEKRFEKNAEKRFEKKVSKNGKRQTQKTGKGSNHHVKNIYISRSSYRKDTSA